MKRKEMEQRAEDYIRCLGQEEKSPSTRKQYQRDIQKFAFF